MRRGCCFQPALEMRAFLGKSLAPAKQARRGEGATQALETALVPVCVGSRWDGQACRVTQQGAPAFLPKGWHLRMIRKPYEQCPFLGAVPLWKDRAARARLWLGSSPQAPGPGTRGTWEVLSHSRFTEWNS